MPLRLPKTLPSLHRLLLTPYKPPIITTIITTITTRPQTTQKPPIRFDQTKKSNDPDGAPTDNHTHNAKEDNSNDNNKPPHPAKQPHTQETPSRSTGVRAEGPGGKKAGEGAGGAAVGKVHEGDKEAVDGAVQHSIKRPIPGAGNTPEGRGGDAL